MQFREFISLKLRKEEITVSMIKDDQYFHQRRILIKMTNRLLILLRMDDSNQPHMYKHWYMIPMVDNNIRISMPELNYEDYFPPVT